MPTPASVLGENPTSSAAFTSEAGAFLSAAEAAAGGGLLGEDRVARRTPTAIATTATRPTVPKRTARWDGPCRLPTGGGAFRFSALSRLALPITSPSGR